MALTQTLSRQTEETAETLAVDVHDPMVMHAAQHLIVRHRQGQRFDIEALDTPHEALAAIAAQLEEAGISHALSDPLIAALRRYIMANGGSFARAANAKPVRINMVVADRMPKARFDQAVTELACLGAREVKVEGATRVNVRATPSGTATSSNAADVDAMFANVRGLYLWIRFEAPTKAELDGLMSAVEAALAGVAQSMGGAMGAGELKKLLDTLQKEGALTPAIAAVVNTLLKIQEGMGKDGKPALSEAALGELVKELGMQMEKAQAQGLLPPALMNAVAASLAEMASDHAVIADFMAEQGLSDLIADNDNQTAIERLEQLMEQVDALQSIEGLDPALAAELAAMMEKIEADLAAGDMDAATALETLGEALADMVERGDVPAAFVEAVEAMLPEQDDAGIADLAQGEVLLAMLEDIAAQIEKGEIDIKDVPPELLALIEKMGGAEALLQQEGRDARIEALAAAVAGQGDPVLAEAVQAAAIILASPEAMAGMPPDIAQVAQSFIASQPSLMEIVAAQGAIKESGAGRDMTDRAAAVMSVVEAQKNISVNSFTASAPSASDTLSSPSRPAETGSVPSPASDRDNLPPPPSASPKGDDTVHRDTVDPVLPPTIIKTIGDLAVLAGTKEPGKIQLPARDAAVQALLDKAADRLAEYKGKIVPTPVLKETLQYLVDARSKAPPEMQKKIGEAIKTLANADPENPEPIPDPSKKPSCGPLCNCHGKTDSRPNPAAEEEVRRSVILDLQKDPSVKIDGDKITFSDGRETTVTTIVRDKQVNDEARDALLARPVKEYTADDFEVTNECPCGHDHGGGGGGHGPHFNNLAQPAYAGLADGGHAVVDAGVIDIQVLKNSLRASKLTNSIK